jgi:hypothetical protein
MSSKGAMKMEGGVLSSTVSKKGEKSGKKKKREKRRGKYGRGEER